MITGPYSLFKKSLNICQSLWEISFEFVLEFSIFTDIQIALFNYSKLVISRLLIQHFAEVNKSWSFPTIISLLPFSSLFSSYLMSYIAYMVSHSIVCALAIAVSLRNSCALKANDLDWLALQLNKIKPNKTWK